MTEPMLLKSSDAAEWRDARLFGGRDSIEGREQELLDPSQIRQIFGHSAAHPRAADVTGGRRHIGRRVRTESRSQRRADLNQFQSTLIHYD